MQNVANLMMPFFDFDGNPASAGRVHFCKWNTSARTSKQITSPDYIQIKNSTGALLPNPLPLNDRGAFTVQPFVDDGIDYKVYVDVPTGIPAEIDDDSMCWKTVSVFRSFDKKIEIEYTGIDSVNSIAELRDVDIEKGKVIVLGYNSADDFCPARIFRYENRQYDENYGTHIKSSKAGGYWVCEPEGFVDVRTFGIDPNDDSRGDCGQVVARIYNDYMRVPIYFPAGNYYFSTNVTIISAILDPGATFHKKDNDIVFSANYVDNKGGYFDDGVIPDVKGELRYSLVHPRSFVRAVSRQYSKIDSVLFDTNFVPTESATVTGKLVRICEGVNVTGVRFVDCVIVNVDSASIRANSFNVNLTSGMVELDGKGLYVGSEGGVTEVGFGKIKLKKKGALDFGETEIEYDETKDSVTIKRLESILHIEPDVIVGQEPKVDIVGLPKYNQGDVVFVAFPAAPNSTICKVVIDKDSLEQLEASVKGGCGMAFLCIIANKTHGYSKWIPLESATISKVELDV